MEVQVEREKTQLFQRFIGDTSHDLRTPISVLNTSVYLLKRLTEQLIEQAELMPQTPEEREARRQQMQQISEKIQERGTGLEQHLEHLQALVESMHEMLRLDMDARFEFTRYNLNTLVLEVLNAHHSNAEAKQLQLDFQPDEALPILWLDSYEFNRVIHNLLQNAVRYTARGGQITVRTYQQAGEIVLEVQDSGIGIADEDLPHIFERLYRADKARSLETGGFGLGLAIVQKIVEGHRGRVEVESTVGKGSVFRVRLPQAQ
jgi:signal transduction histidine kinase